MAIIKTCENCIYYDKEYEHEYCYSCYDNFFVPKEEVIREDTTEKIIEIMKKHLEDYPNAKGYFEQVLDDLKEE